MKLQFIDVVNEEHHILVSHGVPRIGDDVVVAHKDDPEKFRLFRVTRVVWFTKVVLDVNEYVTTVSIPSVEGEEILKEINND